MIKISIAVFFLFLTLSVRADLPVHCLKHQIAGDWKMSISEPHLQGPGPVSCGHHIPDDQESSYTAGRSEYKESSSLNLSLQDDNTVSDRSSKGQLQKPIIINQRTQKGSWTMVYDEGFEILHKNIKYFAFSKYEPTGGRDFNSLCGETLIGWYNNLDNGNRGCYRATKTNEAVQNTQSLERGESVLQPEFMDLDSQEDRPSKTNDRYSSYLDLPIFTQTSTNQLNSDFSEHQKIVDHLNENSDKSWTAKLHPEHEGKSVKELNQMAGRRRYHQGPSVSFSQVNTATTDYSDLPTSFSHHQYLSEARQQKSCGSCYTISTTAMLSARLKMQGEQVDLSPQQSVDCNYYNQGCDGGYPFLVEKFFSENYMVSEQEYPYRAETQSCKKIEFEGRAKLYKVKNYRYIGGSYGTSDMNEIMKEIMNNGPIVMNFEPKYDFMHYGGGIYHSEQSSEMYSTPEWEKVDHSVLTYGWGEENGEKFWMIQNSWGTQWGENGNFRMKRGTDESAIESMAESADPMIITNRNVNKSFLQRDDNQSIFAQNSPYLRQNE